MDYFWATVQDQVKTLSQVGTSSYMAYAMQGVPIWLKKFLLGPIVEEQCNLFSFHVSCLLVHLMHVLESEFDSGSKHVTFVSIYI